MKNLIILPLLLLGYSVTGYSQSNHTVKKPELTLTPLIIETNSEVKTIQIIESKLQKKNTDIKAPKQTEAIKPKKVIK
jgi:hypothetical protein